MINNGQWFADVPAAAWNFPIGGYLPAQKWLKDRKGRTLSYDDIRHYQRIINILIETDRIMRGNRVAAGVNWVPRQARDERGQAAGPRIKSGVTGGGAVAASHCCHAGAGQHPSWIMHQRPVG